ncbi:hypothetical protein B0H63DRAFT_92569 [Podospora didyma]|uniref:Uncharacterized protein n=1 Tax=Podospora didyma TaxID=330526 RepID=A0AAE0N1C9_9PEZI|nr:hypothetical protein B0H63DRAFT_92569 [Podospora didyma]
MPCAPDDLNEWMPIPWSGATGRNGAEGGWMLSVHDEVRRIWKGDREGLPPVSAFRPRAVIIFRAIPSRRVFGFIHLTGWLGFPFLALPRESATHHRLVDRVCISCRILSMDFFTLHLSRLGSISSTITDQQQPKIIRTIQGNIHLHFARRAVAHLPCCPFSHTPQSPSQPHRQTKLAGPAPPLGAHCRLNAHDGVREAVVRAVRWFGASRSCLSVANPSATSCGCCLAFQNSSMALRSCFARSFMCVKESMRGREQERPRPSHIWEKVPLGETGEHKIHGGRGHYSKFQAHFEKCEIHATG